MIGLFKSFSCCGRCFVFWRSDLVPDSNEFGQLLNNIKTYDFNKSRVDLIKISGMIREASG